MYDEHLSDWLDYRRDFEPQRGVDFDFDQPSTRKPTTINWGGTVITDEDYPVPF